MLTFIEDVRPDRYTANGIQVCYMLCTRLWGKARTMHICHKCQSSQPVILAATSTICPFVTGMPSVCFYSFAPHHQRNVTGLVRKRHSLTLWQQSCYGVSERLFNGSQTWKDRTPRSQLPSLRFARFETKLYGHFIGKFGPASHRRSTAHPFLL